MSRKLKKTLSLGITVAAAFVLIMAGMRNGLVVTEYTVFSERLPTAFDGYKIALIADLHGYSFGERQEELIAAVKAAAPDVIALCGDIINVKTASFDSVEYLLSGISEIAPVYAVPGNHELANLRAFTTLLNIYNDYGVIYMNGTAEQINIDKQYITIYSGGLEGDRQGNVWIDSQTWSDNDDGYKIFLFHYGNQFEDMSKNGYDLVLSGHTHGGVIRLFGVGLIDNGGGFFPKYSKGLFNKNGTAGVISAGLGNTALPRFFNPREIVIVTLRHKNS